ncbi:MAG: glycoside hydrolase family 130 protein [Candidatus Aminicenantes bacterium]|nr:glycoside hydrolase family 130 protein [Candidatus Aminicenantes bacterium]
MRRHPDNPLITRKNIPDVLPDLTDVSSVFNPGAARFGKEIKLILRVQSRGRETFFLTAGSRDGIDFVIEPHPIRFEDLDHVKEKIFHSYDARITPLEGSYYITFALDIEDGCRSGLVRTKDFKRFIFMGLAGRQDTRNVVLFPEKIGGEYLRLERPNLFSGGGVKSGTSIILSSSGDLLHWKPVAPVAEGRFHYWDEIIGPGPPPVKTEKGWILIYHGVAMHLERAWIYQAGVMLLDLDDPSRVLGRSRRNILEPREMYEMVGQVPNVVFPSGLVTDAADSRGFIRPDSRVLIYYGAADTSVCLAETTIEELIERAMSD